MADNLEAKHPADDPDRVRPVKPTRERTGKRIDGMPALFFAIDGWLRRREQEDPAQPVLVPATSGWSETGDLNTVGF
jgi:hypothetical protein